MITCLTIDVRDGRIEAFNGPNAISEYKFAVVIALPVDLTKKQPTPLKTSLLPNVTTRVFDFGLNPKDLASSYNHKRK